MMPSLHNFFLISKKIKFGKVKKPKIAYKVFFLKESFLCLQRIFKKVRGRKIWR